jgi:hypothetical protein
MESKIFTAEGAQERRGKRRRKKEGMEKSNCLP